LNKTWAKGEEREGMGRGRREEGRNERKGKERVERGRGEDDI
jgi:hypothetical protein